MHRLPCEALLALDSSGYMSSQASTNCLTRNDKPHRGWFHWGVSGGHRFALILTGIETHGGEPHNVCFLSLLKLTAEPHLQYTYLSLDRRGFDSYAVNSRDLIPYVHRH